MDEFLKIKCPNCEAILVINLHTRQIVEVRKPLIEKSTGDRFKDAFEKYHQDKEEAEKKFEKTIESMKNKKKKLDELLKNRLKEIENG